LAEIWTFRSVVPHRAHAGFGSIRSILPKLGLPKFVLGSANCAWSIGLMGQGEIHPALVSAAQIAE